MLGFLGRQQLKLLKVLSLSFIVNATHSFLKKLKSQRGGATKIEKNFRKLFGERAKFLFLATLDTANDVCVLVFHGNVPMHETQPAETLVTFFAAKKTASLKRPASRSAERSVERAGLSRPVAATLKVNHLIMFFHRKLLRHIRF